MKKDYIYLVLHVLINGVFTGILGTFVSKSASTTKVAFTNRHEKDMTLTFADCSGLNFG